MNIKMPANYLQEKDLIKNIYEKCSYLLKEGCLIILDKFSYDNFKEKVCESFERNKARYIMEVLQGECCLENINELIEKSKQINAKTILGVGGGKVLDTAKAIGYYGDLKTIMFPTAASMDGPCSRISVLYNKKGVFDKYLYLDKNPDAVLVDTQIIANAPAKLLKAGIGDALSTYFETEAGIAGEMERIGTTTISRAAQSISRSCYEVIKKQSTEAVKAVEGNNVNKALEDVIEAIIFLSCVGFENGYLAAAHSVNNALSSLPKYNKFMHGEKVVLGVVTQLLLENKSDEDINEVVEICKKVGLCYKAEEFGIKKEDIDEIAEFALGDDQPIHNMKKNLVNHNKLVNAILSTNHV